MVPLGAEDGAYGHYIRARDKGHGELQMPGHRGLYELRYVLNEGGRTLASAAIEITEPQVTLTGPEAIRAGDEIRLSWTGAVDPRDTITLVAVGPPDGDTADYIRVRGNGPPPVALEMPEQPGRYALRLLDIAGKAVLARKVITVE